MDSILTRIGKKGDNCYNMTGIAYFTREDAQKLHSAIEAEYAVSGHETMFWDDVVNKHIKEFKLKVHPVKQEQIIEIDTVDELEAVSKWIKNNKEQSDNQKL